ncbi:MAG: glycosyltransferase family 4 protein [Arachnia sp.]
MRVLVVAPTINAEDIGEAWVAYQWAHHLQHSVDLTVLTYPKRGQSPIAPQLPQARVVQWRELPGVGRLERFNSLLKPSYYPFYLGARRWIARHRGAFDVGIQPLPVAMRYPSPLLGGDFPWVMGPVGGGLASPPGFVAEETGPWYLGLRRLDRARLRCERPLRATYGQADCVVGIADYVRDNLDGVALRRFATMSETGLDAMPPQTPRAVGEVPTRQNPLRLLFVGRLIRTKGARDAIAAMAMLEDVWVRLDIVGDGFDRHECEQLVARLGLRDRVRFHGRVDHDEVDRFYRDADVFCFPSYREPGGNVVFEAMGHSLPLIVCQRGGPGAAVDDECAIRLPAEDPHQLAAAVAGAVRELAADPQRRHQMGQASRSRLAQVGLWPAKVERMLGLCRELIHQT